MCSMAIAKTGHSASASFLRLEEQTSKIFTSNQTFQALFSSHMNSLAGHLNLFAHRDCQTIISARGMNIDDILQSRSMFHFEMPELSALLNEAAVSPFSYEKTFEQARLDPYLTLHTSGSTGLPKPIVMNHAFIAAMETTLNLIPDTIANQPVLKR